MIDCSLIKRIIAKMVANQSQEFNLIFLLEGEQLVEELVRRWRSYKTVYIHVDERGHYDLTVKSVHESAMTGYTIAEIFDLECALESAGKKSAKRSDCRREY